MEKYGITPHISPVGKQPPRKWEAFVDEEEERENEEMEDTWNLDRTYMYHSLYDTLFRYF